MRINPHLKAVSLCVCHRTPRYTKRGGLFSPPLEVS